MDTVKKIFKTPVFWVVAVIFVLIAGVVTAGIYQYNKVQTELAKLKDTPSGGQLTDERQRELIAEVSAKILLPSDEKPTVAVVSDINRLKDQQFFASGLNGDIVLIYMNSRKAILYRPAEKKIIEVAPVNLSNNQATPSAQQVVAGAQTTNPAPTQMPGTPAITPTTAQSPITGTFALRNGTTITGLARNFESQLTSKVPGVSVTERGNAAVRTYTATMIIDVKGTKSSEAALVAKTLGIQTGTLPVGEPTTNADFLIIIGSDKR